MNHDIRRPCAMLAALALAALSACAERREARGLVLKVDGATAQVTVSHDAIPGYMDAMVMRLTASRPEELKDVRPGDTIAFRLTSDGERTRIGDIAILSAAPADAGIRQSPAVSTLVPIGGVVPDFTLTDQDGAPVSLHALRGKVVALGFVYTRCPLPDYCPRVITNQSALRNRFNPVLGKDLVLLTITFDPRHDTPERMKAFAASYGADVPGWRFLTGDLADIARVCALFGVEFWPEEGLITHTLQTAVVDREGRLTATAEGKDFSPRQLSDLVGETLQLR